MNDTPRTDAEVFLLFKTGDDEGVTAEFARKLERENAALRDALDCIAGNHGERSPVTLTEAQEEARAALARKEAQP